MGTNKETDKRKSGRKAGLLRCTAGLLLAMAVIFNMTPFEGVAASEGAVYSGSETPVEYSVETAPLKTDNGDETNEPGSESPAGTNNKDESNGSGSEPPAGTNNGDGTNEPGSEPPAGTNNKDETNEPGSEPPAGTNNKDGTNEPGSEPPAGTNNGDETNGSESEPSAGTNNEEEKAEPGNEPPAETDNGEEKNEPGSGLPAGTDSEQAETGKTVDELAVYFLMEKTETQASQEPKTGDATLRSASFDFGSDANTPSGDLATDNYHWEGSEGSYTLTLKDFTCSGTVCLPDDTIVVVIDGNCSINQLEIKNSNPQKTKLTFSGNGELTINERINIFGGNGNALTIGAGTRVNANKGIGIGASGSADATVTVNGTLNVTGEGSSNAISTGQVIVGNGGTLNVSGDNGVLLNGMGTNDYKDMFIVREGGCLAASCKNFNVRIQVTGTPANTDGAVNVPDGYLPDDCEVRLDSSTIKLVHISTGQEYCNESFTIRSGICSHENTEVRGQKDATCTVEGNTGYRFCIDCNTKISSDEVIPALGHDWHITSENEKRVYTCSRCGETREEEIQKQSEDTHSHSYKKGVLENATCTKAGTAIFTCDCGDTYTEGISALKHTYTHKVTTEPTIFAEGVMTYICSRCGDRYTERIPQLEQHEHVYSVLVLKEATCTEAGISMYACDCGAAYTESFPMLTHRYDSRVTRDVMTYTCSRCNDTYTKPVERIEAPLSGVDSRPESRNQPVGEDQVVESSTEPAREETNDDEEQSIVTDDAVTETAAADADVSTAVEVVDTLPQTGKQFPWWILLIAVLVMAIGLFVTRILKNRNEQ